MHARASAGRLPRLGTYWKTELMFCLSSELSGQLSNMCMFTFSLEEMSHFHVCKPYRVRTLSISVTELCTCIFVFACMHEHVGCVFERYCMPFTCVSGGQILQMGPDGSLNLWRCGTDSVWAFCNAWMQHRLPRCACVSEHVCVCARGENMHDFLAVFFSCSHIVCVQNKSRYVLFYNPGLSEYV